MVVKNEFSRPHTAIFQFFEVSSWKSQPCATPETPPRIGVLRGHGERKNSLSVVEFYSCLEIGRNHLLLTFACVYIYIAYIYIHTIRDTIITVSYLIFRIN